MLAGMLLETNRPDDALKQYDLSLKNNPNRFRSLSGAAHAAELARQPDRAKEYYELLLKGRGQSHNAELEHARAYVSRATPGAGPQ
jgi:hypothetical protein